MQERVEHLQRFFELSLDLLCIAGVDGYFKIVNPAFERVLGYSTEELLSRSFLELVHPDDRRQTEIEIDRLSRGKPVVDFQNRYRARDGSWKWLAWRSMPVKEQGLIYAVARDITDRKRVEHELQRQTAELERSNAELEQFAYVASHDLQAPLRAIANLAGWIEEDMPEGFPAAVEDHLEKLRSRVRRMQQMVDDLLQYSRAGHEPHEIVRVDVGELLREITGLLAPPEGIVVETGELPVFETARAPLEQVLRNLVGNAVKHHDRKTGQVRVSAIDRGARWEFLVADDGPGIPADERDKIFHMFHQLGTRDEIAGTGIGLAVVKKLVSAHGGRIWVESAIEGSAERATEGSGEGAIERSGVGATERAPGCPAGGGTGRGAIFHFTWPKRIRDE